MHYSNISSFSFQLILTPKQLCWSSQFATKRAWTLCSCRRWSATTRKNKHVGAELWYTHITSSPVLSFTCSSCFSPFFSSQAVQHHPSESTELAEGHQRLSGDGCRAGGSSRQFDSGKGPREVGQALLPKLEAFGQLHHRLSLKAQVFAGETA